MTSDPFARLKADQKEGWALFAPFENITVVPAAALVNFAKIKPGQKVLDAACGTGVVSITAARQGAQVKGIDLSPVLIEKAQQNAKVARLEIDFISADIEALPFKDCEFDIVLSQFGHMFAPRPEVTLSEMLRVLKPGGTIAFSTWPPEHITGMMFSITAKYNPPPKGVAAASLWGDPKVIVERFGSSVANIAFDRDVLCTPAISPQHLRLLFESNLGPFPKIKEKLESKPAELKKFQEELESLIAIGFKDNVVRQPFLMTHATKV